MNPDIKQYSIILSTITMQKQTVEGRDKIEIRSNDG